MSTTATSDAMMSLMQKHANLYELVEQCRASQRVAVAERERLDDALETLQTSRRAERLASKREQERVHELREILNGDTAPVVSLQRQLDQAEAEFAAATSAHHHAEQASLRWKAYKQEKFHQALENSRQFQRQCPRWQIQVAAMEPDLITAAALRACHNECEAVSLEAMCADRINIFVPHDDGDENDPSTWTIPDDDFALSELVTEYNRLTQSRDEAAVTLDASQKEQNVVSTRCKSRLERLQQLEMQLSRIVADCDKLQSQTAELQMLTDEDTALAAVFHSKMEQRRNKHAATSATTRRVSLDGAGPRHVRRPLAASTVSRSTTPRFVGIHTTGTAQPLPTRNPYATKRPTATATQSQVATADTEAVEKRPRRDELAAIVLGPSALARRSHRDRRFGCTFEVSGATNETHEQQVSPPASNEPVTNQPIDDDF